MLGKYQQRMRQSTKYFLIIIASILLLISILGLIQNLFFPKEITKTSEIYNYTNKFNYDYKVNLIKNEYMSVSQITDKSLAYVTDLIDNIDFDLNYEYEANKESKVEYKYSVTGRMAVVYTKDGDEQKIWEETESVIDEKEVKALDGKEFNIAENIKLDLKEKNKLLNKFKQEMGMNIDAKYFVTLNVEVLTNVEEKDIEDKYSSVISLDLAEKTTSISGENDKSETEYVSKEYAKVNNINIPISIIDAILLAVSICIFKYTFRAQTRNQVKNTFRQDLNRILRMCQDKIVEVDTEPNESPEDVVKVKEFEEIYKVSEELFQPILYYFDKIENEAYFSVMANNFVYRYILRG